MVQDGHYATLGCSVYNGYREFKVTDRYKDDVIAVVFYLLGSERKSVNTNNVSLIIDAMPIKAKSIEFATFSINGDLFALETEHVLEAHAASKISSVSIGSRSERVGILAIPSENEEKAYVWVYDVAYLLSGVPSIRDSSSQVVVVNYQDHKIGLLVSALNSVTEFDINQISASPLLADNNGALIKKII